jgi:7,8-dihydropterin-6-yl-methyl-4-(beta-D-ribofuranosyl)aminobenzene 5'-phosphate synthase
VSALPIDPSFEEIASAGGTVETHAKGHAVAGGTVWVSGEIPRVSTFEEGIFGGRTWTEDNGWVKDEVRAFC